MQQREKIITKDGQAIVATMFRPNQAISKVMIIGSDVLASQKIYENFAQYLANMGCLVYTFDYRGIGLSLSKKIASFNATMNQWGFMDLDAIILHAKHRNPRHEIVFLAHGTSGQLLGFSPASQYLDNAIFINTALSCSRYYSWYRRIEIALHKTISPALRFLLGYYPGSRMGFKQDLPSGVSLELSDWCSKPNGLFDFFPDSNFRKIEIPILAYSFTDDWLSPEMAVRVLLQHYTHASISWMHLSPGDVGKKNIGRSGFFESKNKTTFWTPIAQWMALAQEVKNLA